MGYVFVQGFTRNDVIIITINNTNYTYICIFIHIPRSTFGCFSSEERNTEEDKAVEAYLRREHKKLGPVR